MNKQTQNTTVYKSIQRFYLLLLLFLSFPILAFGQENIPFIVNIEQYKFAIIAGLFLVILGILVSRIRLLHKIKAAQKREIKAMSDYMELVHNMPIIYTKVEVVYNRSNRPVDVVFKVKNQFFSKVFEGFDDVIEKKGSESFIADYIPQFLDLLRVVLAKENSVTVPFYLKTEKTFYEVVLNPSNTPCQVDIFALDVTKLYRIQYKLSSTNKKLATALDVAKITPWKWDLADKTILCDVNKPISLSFIKQKVDDKQVLISEELYFAQIHVDDQQKVNEAYHKLITGQVKTASVEYRIFSTRESRTHVHWIETRATIERYDKNGNPRVLVGSSMDITARKIMEQELISAKEHAEESSRMKSAFLANMSHEIRTPLNAIVGFSGILANTTEEDERQEYIQLIESNNTLLLQLVNDILDMSKIEAGTLEFFYSDFELNEFLDILLSAIRSRITSDNVEVILEKTQPICYIHTERNRLTQVLTGLLTNALKFTEAGYVKVTYSIKNDGYLYFSVTDTGTGIPRDKLAAIFERFVKLNAFTQGTGLGLPICSLIVQKMNGEIGVESEEGVGSTFWFTIPYVPGEKIETKENYFRNLPSVPKDKLTLLVAEDQASNYKLFKSILQEDYRIIHAWDGKEAVELFKEYSPHIILMDINMPVMDGYEATREIRKLSPKVPIVAVTAYAYASDEKRIIESGFSGYIPKPIDANVLHKEIDRLLKENFTLI